MTINNLKESIINLFSKIALILFQNKKHFQDHKFCQMIIQQTGI